MRRIRPRWTWLLVAAGLALTAVACTGPTDTPARRSEAMATADEYLRAVSGATDDRGWSLLHAASRAEWASEDQYVAAVRQVDWSSFEFRVVEAVFCDDGVMCSVTVKVPGGIDAVPDFLRVPGKNSAAGLRFDDPERSDHAAVWVWLPDLMRGPGGVLLTAG